MSAQVIEETRKQIDQMDEQILELVERRISLSGHIQRLRIDSGGTRVEHARENFVIRRYRTRFGKSGASMIMAILELCRGRIAEGKQPAGCG
ncbi:chorismate mutase [Amycolatopsis minnesotensis]|uniref:Chorismate mutase n=1 Tax=Amycolatopsis minnesotensis TaxID=337894 RepID=A0ABN2RVI1_9PSEU